MHVCCSTVVAGFTVALRTFVMQRLMPQCRMWRNMTKSLPIQKGPESRCRVYYVSHYSHVIHMGLVGHFRLNDVQDAKMIVAQTFSKFNEVASFGVTNEDRETSEPLYTNKP